MKKRGNISDRKYWESMKAEKSGNKMREGFKKSEETGENKREREGEMKKDFWEKEKKEEENVRIKRK